MDLNEFAGLEVWRGGVNTWECDEMGHLNVRFYVARAMEGLVGLADAIGLPGAFSDHATSTLIVRDHHIRFLREARSSAPLHLVVGVLEMAESEAKILQLLVHSLTGVLAAAFQTIVAHATPGDGRQFPWSARSRLLASGLAMSPPERARPRSLVFDAVESVASAADADRLNLIPLGSGAVSPADCDVFGRMRPDVFIGRVSDGIPTLGSALQSREGDEPFVRPPGVGGAVLEYRVCYQRWPLAGDRFEIRSGLIGVGDRTQHYAHWMLDPRSGRPWVTAEAVAVSLDLGARKIIPHSVEERARLQARVIPGLRL